MVEKKTWQEFRNTGLLWFINTTLHLFGWALVVEIDGDEVKNCYPARIKFRGFGEKDTDEGYKKLTGYVADNINDLVKEVEE